MKSKTALITAVIMAAVCLGLWLIISPSLENNGSMSRQNELLASIAGEIADNAADDCTTQADCHFEAEPEETEHEPVLEAEPVYIPLYPLDDSEFPNAVTGIGIMTIDRINLRLPIADGISEAGLRIAPGRVPETAKIGETGNAVIAGHRNYTFGEMFNRLDEVEIGDIIGFQSRIGVMMEFEVFEIIEINPDDQIAFIQPVNESIITLYTCTPVREATHRLLVRAIKI